MSVEEQNKAVLTRWYDEMWQKRKFKELMPELAGPEYTRHEPDGTRVVTNDQYAEELTKLSERFPPYEAKYDLIADQDKVAVVGTMKMEKNLMHWVQIFRLEKGKLVETWFPGWVRDVEW